MSAKDTLVAMFPFVPLRAKPNDRSEMVSQVIAGERITVLDNLDGNWLKLRCNHDGYEGYADSRHFKYFDSSGEESATMYVSQGVTFVGQRIGVVFPAGTKLSISPEYLSIAGRPLVGFKMKSLYQTLHSMSEVAMTFIGVPYLWGGRTFAGIDCSGLTQISAQLCGSKPLPRDASDQAKVGTVVSWDDRQANDLAFFVNKKDEVTHVAIILCPDEVIHASGSVRIDTLSSDGIIHCESGELTHKLHSIKRLR